MRKEIILLVTILFISSIYSERVKRKLVFTKGSRFFIRLNIRENLFKYTTIFTYALGFRMNWDLPDKILHGKRKKMQRRDLYRGIEHFIDQNNGNGQACVRKFLCETSTVLKNSKDFLAQLYSIIFLPHRNDQEHSYVISEEMCRKVTDQCPLSILHLVYKSD